MKTLYLHIGTPKTGSSSIQEYCAENTQALEKEGFCYPLFPYRFKNRGKNRNGNFLNFLCTLPNGIAVENQKKINIDMVEDCIKIIGKKFEKFDNVILSDERCWRALGKYKINRWERLWKYSQENNIQIKLIVYLRRQDEFFESAWNQEVKHMGNHEKWEDFIQRASDSYPDYYERLNELSELVGKKNIIVRRFQAGALVDDNIVADFFHAIGIHINGGSNKQVYKNTRLCSNMMYIKMQINKMASSSKNACAFAEKALLKCQEEYGMKHCTMSFMSEKEAREIVEKYKENNDKVARVYIGDDKPLFNDKYKKSDKWQINNPDMIEDLIKGMSAIYADTFSIIEEQNRRIKNLEKRNIFQRLKKRM